MSKFSDSSNESDVSLDYTHKIRHTNNLISQLESKLQTYIKPPHRDSPQRDSQPQNLLSQLRQKVNNLTTDKSVDTNLLNPSSYLNLVARNSEQLTMSPLRFISGEHSQIKSKMELEKEIFDFEQRMKQFQMPQHSQNTSFVIPESSKNSRLHTFSQNKLIDQSLINDQTNTMKTENPQTQDLQLLWTLQPQNQQYDKKDQTNVKIQQDIFLQSINDKLYFLQGQDESKCSQMEKQIQFYQNQQVELLSERNQVSCYLQSKNRRSTNRTNYRSQLLNYNNLKKVYNISSLGYSNQILKEDAQIIMNDQTHKINRIQTQSEDLIEDENNKRKKFEIELSLLKSDKDKLIQEINNLKSSELTNNKNNLSQQLNSLFNLHNQFLQTDIKKTMTSIQQTPQIKFQRQTSDKKSNQDILQKLNDLDFKQQKVDRQQALTPQLSNQIDFLYNLNLQLKETMEQQLKLIRDELYEQKCVNKDLLCFLQSSQNKYPDHQPAQGMINQEDQDESYALKQKYFEQFSNKLLKLDLYPPKKLNKQSLQLKKIYTPKKYYKSQKNRTKQE